MTKSHDDDEPMRPLTPHEILAALRAARQPVSDPDRVTAAFLDGYDTCLEQLARLVDFPWHERTEQFRAGQR